MASETAEFDLGRTQLEHMGLPFPITCTSQTSLRDVIRILKDNGTGSILIQDGTHLAGIFTERDFVLRVLGKNVNWEQPIEHFMTRTPICISEDATLQDAIKVLNEKDIRHLPIQTKDQEAYKILSVRDVIDFLAEFFPREVLNLPGDSQQKFHNRDGA